MKSKIESKNYADVKNITNDMRNTIKELNKVKFSLNLFFFFKKRNLLIITNPNNITM